MNLRSSLGLAPFWLAGLLASPSCHPANGPATPADGPVSRPDVTAVDLALIRAERRLAAGQWEVAEGMFRRLLEQQPDSAEVIGGLGRALEGQGRCDQALRWLSQTREGPAWSARLAASEAWCRMRTGDLEGAVRGFERAIALDDVGARSWIRYGRTLLMMGDVGGARKALDTVERSWPTAGTLLAAEIALETDQDFDAAWKQFDTFASSPRSAPWLPVISRVFGARRTLDLGDARTAADKLHEAIRLGIRNAEAAAWRAEALRRTHNLEMARRAITRKRIAEQQHPWLDAIGSRLLADEGRLDEARDLLAAHEPTTVEILASRWYVAQAANDPAAAAWAERWRAVNRNPLRTLEALLPVTGSP